MTLPAKPVQLILSDNTIKIFETEGGSIITSPANITTQKLQAKFILNSNQRELFYLFLNNFIKSDDDFFQLEYSDTFFDVTGPVGNIQEKEKDRHYEIDCVFIIKKDICSQVKAEIVKSSADLIKVLDYEDIYTEDVSQCSLEKSELIEYSNWLIQLLNLIKIEEL